MAEGDDVRAFIRAQLGTPDGDDPRAFIRQQLGGDDPRAFIREQLGQQEEVPAEGYLGYSRAELEEASRLGRPPQPKTTWQEEVEMAVAGPAAVAEKALSIGGVAPWLAENVGHPVLKGISRIGSGLEQVAAAPVLGAEAALGVGTATWEQAGESLWTGAQNIVRGIPMVATVIPGVGLAARAANFALGVGAESALSGIGWDPKIEFGGDIWKKIVPGIEKVKFGRLPFFGDVSAATVAGAVTDLGAFGWGGFRGGAPSNLKTRPGLGLSLKKEFTTKEFTTRVEAAKGLEPIVAKARQMADEFPGKAAADKQAVFEAALVTEAEHYAWQTTLKDVAEGKLDPEAVFHKGGLRWFGKTLTESPQLGGISERTMVERAHMAVEPPTTPIAGGILSRALGIADDPRMYDALLRVANNESRYKAAWHHRRDTFLKEFMAKGFSEKELVELTDIVEGVRNTAELDVLIARNIITPKQDAPSRWWIGVRDLMEAEKHKAGIDFDKLGERVRIGLNNAKAKAASRRLEMGRILQTANERKRAEHAARLKDAEAEVGALEDLLAHREREYGTLEFHKNRLAVIEGELAQKRAALEKIAEGELVKEVFGPPPEVAATQARSFLRGGLLAEEKPFAGQKELGLAEAKRAEAFASQQKALKRHAAEERAAAGEADAAASEMIRTTLALVAEENASKPSTSALKALSAKRDALAEKIAKANGRAIVARKAAENVAKYGDVNALAEADRLAAIGEARLNVRLLEATAGDYKRSLAERQKAVRMLSEFKAGEEAYWKAEADLRATGAYLPKSYAQSVERLAKWEERVTQKEAAVAQVPGWVPLNILPKTIYALHEMAPTKYRHLPESTFEKKFLRIQYDPHILARQWYDRATGIPFTTRQVEDALRAKGVDAKLPLYSKVFYWLNGEKPPLVERRFDRLVLAAIESHAKGQAGAASIKELFDLWGHPLKRGDSPMDGYKQLEVSWLKTAEQVQVPIGIHDELKRMVQITQSGEAWRTMASTAKALNTLYATLYLFPVGNYHLNNALGGWMNYAYSGVPFSELNPLSQDGRLGAKLALHRRTGKGIANPDAVAFTVRGEPWTYRKLLAAYEQYGGDRGSWLDAEFHQTSTAGKVARLNPLSVHGPWVRLGKYTAGIIEDHMRLAGFSHKIRKGESPFAAGDFIALTQNRYDMVPDEAKAIRDSGFLFYNWARFNAQFQIRNMARNPGLYALSEEWRESLKRTDNVLDAPPWWFDQGAAVYTYTDAQGNEHFATGMMLSYEDFLSWLPWDRRGRFAPTQPVRQLLTSYAPWITFIGEQTLGIDFRTGKKLEERFTRAPTGLVDAVLPDRELQEAFGFRRERDASVGGKEYMTGDPVYIHALNRLPYGRIVGNLLTAENPRLNTGEALATAFGGLKFVALENSRQAQNAADYYRLELERLAARGKVKRYGGTFYEPEGAEAEVLLKRYSDAVKAVKAVTPTRLPVAEGIR